MRGRSASSRPASNIARPPNLGQSPAAHTLAVLWVLWGADDAEVLGLIKPFIVDVVHVSPGAAASSFTPPTLTSLNVVPPPSTSSSSTSSSTSTLSRAERRLWTVPSLDVWFFGSSAAELHGSSPERVTAATSTPLGLVS